MSTETKWLLEHAEVTAAGLDFVWDYWTDVAHWDDPPAEFHLDGPFAVGSRGTTVLPDAEPVYWVLRDVDAGRSYTIETEMGGAVLRCQWLFEPQPDAGTRLRQRIGLAGPSTDQHEEMVREGFGPTLADGMQRTAALLAEAEAKSRQAD